MRDISYLSNGNGAVETNWQERCKERESLAMFSSKCVPSILDHWYSSKIFLNCTKVHKKALRMEIAGDIESNRLYKMKQTGASADGNLLLLYINRACLPVFLLIACSSFYLDIVNVWNYVSSYINGQMTQNKVGLCGIKTYILYHTWWCPYFLLAGS